MLELEASGWFTITGRGRVAGVNLRQIHGCPERFNSISELPVHTGQHVRIDGAEYEIRSIECTQALMYPPFIKPDVGLLVKAVSAPSPPDPSAE